MNNGRTKQEEADFRARMITIDIKVPVGDQIMGVSRHIDPLLLGTFGFGIINIETERAVDELERAYEEAKA